MNANVGIVTTQARSSAHRLQENPLRLPRNNGNAIIQPIV